MPDRPALSEASVSGTSLPMLLTMPMPVTTTRRTAGVLRSEIFGRGEQADAHVAGLVDVPAVDAHHAVGDAEHQLAPDHALDVDVIADPIGRGQDLAGELDLADAQRPALARQAEPAEVRADQLPERVETEAARHDRIGFEMAGEEPEIGADVELGHDLALAVGAAILVDVRDAVEHEQRRQRQTGIARAEQ